MDQKPLSSLPVINIASPCSEKWEEMDGDSRSRFCAKCQHGVLCNEGLSGDELDSLTSGSERVCLRLTVHPSKGVLTRDGWLPRLVTAGIAAVVISGCSGEMTGEAISTKPPVQVDQQKPDDGSEMLLGKVAIEPSQVTGTPAVK